MKLDVFNWNEVKTNGEVPFEKGWLRLRFSAPSALYVEVEGYQALVGFGSSFDVEIGEKGVFTVEAAKGVRAFQHVPPEASFHADGETFTNIDRLPHENSNLAEVTAAMRRFKLEQMASIADLRGERLALRRERLARSAGADLIEDEK